MAERSGQEHPILIGVLFCLLPASAVELDGAGATFPFDVYSSWLPAYKAYRRSFREIVMKYDSIGSGAGIARIKGIEGPAVAYAGSDSLLTEEEYKVYPDLQMLPSIAGAVVLAFNIPGVSHLNLSMAHIVGIYNGSIRYWNDSSLVGLNPHVSLPEKAIQVAARREKSGTTELFTAALSSVDRAWRNRYGTFSQGLRENDTPYVWDSNVVTLYGETNRGVSGMILSTKYSIGYLVRSDAVSAKMPIALLQNAAGKLVEASAVSVQNAMDDFANSFSERMTVSLANPSGPQSYPISGYTYLIIHMTTMTDCLLATELVRYIEWFYTDEIARVECENLYMIPLSSSVYTTMIDKVLKHVQCGGRNVYDMVENDKEREELALQTWRTPLYVAVPLIGVLFIVLTLYLVRDQLRTHRALLRDEWKLPQQAISFSQGHNSLLSSRISVSKSRSRIHPTSISSLHVSASNMPEEEGRIGRYKTERVVLTEMYMLTSAVSLRMKRGILMLRDHVHHANLTKFFGLYLDVDRQYYMVSEYCAKGSLQNLLHGTSYNLDANFKYALCLGVARGMDYLHSHKLIHGSLTSNKIYLDDKWCVKLGGWAVHQVASLQGKSSLCVDMGVTEWASEEFWIAPEVLSQRSLPTTAADIYSLAIVIQEIFSRDVPYAELSDFLTPGEVLDKVVCESLRPLFTPNTPLGAREIMKHAWEMDPHGRPHVTDIVRMIRKACPEAYSVMDSMLDSLLKYVAELKDESHHVQGQGLLNDKPKVQQSSDLNGIKTNVGNKQLTTIPRALRNADLTPHLLGHVTVLIVCVHDIDKLIRVSTPQEVTEFVTDLQQGLEVTIGNRHHQDVLTVSVVNDSYTLATNVLQQTTDNLRVIASLALDFLHMATTFTIRHRREDRLSLRVGMGTGSAVVGLAGQGEQRFILIGEACSRAQSMLTTCLPMCIQLDYATYSSLTTFKFFTCIERKYHKETAESKSIVAPSYWLIGHRDSRETFMPVS